MDASQRTDFTQILLALASGRRNGHVNVDRAFEIVYGELRKLAERLMQGERSDHTLQPTALVHETYCRLVDHAQVQWQDRAHFFGIAARAMRRILVDHARRRLAARRGGRWQKLPFDENLCAGEIPDEEILALHDALDRLKEMDERMSTVVEMRIFGGLTADEIAHVLGVSRRTVQSDWRVARMWLGKELAGGALS